MTNVNYMEVMPGGHCLTCHKDFTEKFEEHPCMLNPKPTVCPSNCRNKYVSKAKEWFIERIGKKIYRNDNTCSCHNCIDIKFMGMIVSDERHALYLSEVDSEYANEGVLLNYRDEK